MTAEINGALERLKAQAARREAEAVRAPTVPQPVYLSESDRRASEEEARRIEHARRIAAEKEEVNAILNRWLNNATENGKRTAQAECLKVIGFINAICSS